MSASPAARVIEIPVPTGPGALEGRLCEAEGTVAAALIAAPHPLYGGSLDVPVVSELAQACAAAACSTLRFNWRGVGASAGAPSGDPEDADADYRAALGRLAVELPGPLLAAGYSFGAAAALRCSAGDAGVSALLLVAPPPSLMDVELLRGFPGPALLLTGSEDGLAPAGTLETWTAAMPNAELVVVSAADHFFGSTPGAVAAAAGAWLQRSFPAELPAAR